MTETDLVVFLNRLYKAKKSQKGCVAYGFEDDNPKKKRYFAVNGKATSIYKDLKPVLDVFGDSPIFLRL